LYSDLFLALLEPERPESWADALGSRMSLPEGSELGIFPTTTVILQQKQRKIRK
jgi:hypothetical protein